MSEQESEPDADALGEAYDAFSPENIGVIHFIQLGRIYDVLMGMYMHTAPEQARDLLEVHYKGALMGPSPRFNGNFVTDDMEGEAQSTTGDSIFDNDTAES